MVRRLWILLLQPYDYSSAREAVVRLRQAMEAAPEAYLE